MKRPLLGVCLLLIFLCCAGVILGVIPSKPELPEILTEADEVTLRAKVQQKDGDKIFLSSIVILDLSADLRNTFPIKNRIIVTYDEIQGQEIPKSGQQIVLQGKFGEYSSATNPGEADIKQYYASLNVCGRLKNVSIMWADQRYDRLAEWLYRLRMRCKERLYLVFPAKEASVMSALLIGDKSDLDTETKELYQRNGIIHILSISGLHVTVIGLGVFSLLKKAGLGTKTAAFAGAAALVLYGMFVGMGITVIRAVGMYLLKQLSRFTGRTYDMPTAAGVLAAFLVCINPLYLTNSGFLLSFGAVCGAGIVYPVLFKKPDSGKRRGEPALTDGKIHNILRSMAKKASDCLMQSILLSLSVTAATLPVLLHSYYEIPVFSALVNILVLPFMSLLLVTGLIVMAIPGTGMLGTVDCLILAFYEKVCRNFDRLPFRVWNPGCPKTARIVIYYLILAAGMTGFMVWDRNKKTDVMKNECLRRAIRKIAPGLLLTVLVMILAAPEKHGVEIFFLDVGQGDGAILRTSHDRVYLFDFGSTSRSEPGKYLLRPFLKYMGIGRLDVVTISHRDADHINGILELMENGESWGISVGQILVPEGKDGEYEAICQMLTGTVDKTKDETKTTAKAGNLAGTIKIEAIESGMSWTDDGVLFACLNPDSGARYSSSNASSACFLVQAEGVTLLFTGDVEKEGEERLTGNLEFFQPILPGEKRNVDILKVAHHGSRYSTGEDFLDRVNPVVSVISCGRRNRYGHPHDELLLRLSESGTEIFRTDVGGAVTVRIDNGRFSVEEYLGN